MAAHNTTRDRQRNSICCRRPTVFRQACKQSLLLWPRNHHLTVGICHRIDRTAYFNRHRATVSWFLAHRLTVQSWFNCIRSGQFNQLFGNTANAVITNIFAFKLLGQRRAIIDRNLQFEGCVCCIQPHTVGAGLRGQMLWRYFHHIITDRSSLRVTF